MITTESTVREIALENPSTIRVFETLGIDYCCGGKRNLSDACTHAKVPLARALELLENAGKDARDDGDPSNEIPLHALTARIVAKHHSFVRSETPRIQALLTKVLSRHGDAHPEVRQIEALFLAMAQELSTHMLKEEQVLFPYLEKMEAAFAMAQPLPPAFFGSVANPIAKMMADHDDAGALMARIRELSGGFAPPANACPTYRGLYHSLAEFESDLHRHVHLENNILFPRAARMETAAAATACSVH
jgi:regulator of cell morphogenesis and NO signaling